MSEPKHYSLEAETGRYELKGHDVDLRVANSWDELADHGLNARRAPPDRGKLPIKTITNGAKAIRRRSPFVHGAVREAIVR